MKEKQNNKNSKKHRARGSYSYSHTVKPHKKGNNDLSEFEKRGSQTYHSLFKDKDRLEQLKHSKTRKYSRVSRRSKRLSNPFAPISSALVSSSSSSELTIGEFHNVGEIANTLNYRTDKAVNLKNGKPIVVKYFKVNLNNYLRHRKSRRFRS